MRWKQTDRVVETSAVDHPGVMRNEEVAIPSIDAPLAASVSSRGARSGRGIDAGPDRADGVEVSAI
jgi:hypothetical protein